MEAFNSIYIVPLGAFAVAIVAIISGIYSQAHATRLKADQRMAMIARGASVEEIERLLGKKDELQQAPKDPLRSLAVARRTGIVLISCGVGIKAFFLFLAIILRQREVLAGAAVGLIPLAIGIGFFIDYHLQKRELSRFGLEIDSSSGNGLS